MPAAEYLTSPYYEHWLYAAEDLLDKKGAVTRAQLEQRMAEFHSRLKERGLKSTGQRDDIASVFFALDRHISAEELHAEVRKVNPHVGYATIYRTLRLRRVPL